MTSSSALRAAFRALAEDAAQACERAARKMGEFISDAAQRVDQTMHRVRDADDQGLESFSALTPRGALDEGRPHPGAVRSGGPGLEGGRGSESPGSGEDGDRVRAAKAKMRAGDEDVPGPGGPKVTEPSRMPDPNAVPEGPPETSPNADVQTRASLAIQNRTAEILARAGYRVRRIPNPSNEGSADFEIEGHIFDGYALKDSLKTMKVKFQGKMGRGQAERFVINLEQSTLSVEDVRDFLARPNVRTDLKRMKEVLVIGGQTVTRVFP